MRKLFIKVIETFGKHPIVPGAHRMMMIVLAVMLYTGAHAQLGSYYNGTSHYKSKGLSWGIKKPLGFTQKEADRPNIVQKWVIGGTSIHTMVKNLPSEMQGFEKADWVEYLSQGGAEELGKEMGADRASYSVIDNYPAVKTYQSTTHRRLDLTIDIYTTQYMVILEDVAFVLQLVSSSKAAHDKHSKLLYQLANTVIFYEQYGN